MAEVEIPLVHKKRRLMRVGEMVPTRVDMPAEGVGPARERKRQA